MQHAHGAQPEAERGDEPQNGVPAPRMPRVPERVGESTQRVRIACAQPGVDLVAPRLVHVVDEEHDEGEEKNDGAVECERPTRGRPRSHLALP